LDYCGHDRNELDMVFNFNHVQASWDPKLGRFGPSQFDLPTHKMILNDWQQALAEDGWNSLYLSNHDLPRPVSHYADDKEHRVRSAKMLAMVHYLMKGTPFIFQGEEIGMTNVHFTSLDQFRDIETIGQLTERLGPVGSNKRDEESVQEFLKSANSHGRDNARTPVQWDSGFLAGFSNVASWIDVNENFDEINVEADRANPDGVFAFYKQIIALRKTQPIITHGSFELFATDDPAIFAYAREWEGQRLVVLANFSGAEVTIDIPELIVAGLTPLLATDRPSRSGQPQILEPYEGYAWLV
jgi:oligo-1,6-glucosidase